MHTSTFTARTGGVMTVEVGVITGDLELHTARADTGEVTVTVRYDGAEDWYHVRGTSVTIHDDRDLRALHDTLAAVLAAPPD